MKKGSGSVIIVTILIVLLLGVITYLAFRYELFRPSDVLNESNYTYLALRCFAGNSEINADYILFEDDEVVQEGRTSKNALEVYDNPVNATYELGCYNDQNKTDYYYNESFCDMNGLCKVRMAKEGSLDLSINSRMPSSINYSLEVHNGIVNAPIICFSWTSGIIRLKTDLQKVANPIRFRYTYDACYKIPSSSFVIEAQKDQDSAFLYWNVIDRCMKNYKMGYSDCGIEDYKGYSII